MTKNTPGCDEKEVQAFIQKWSKSGGSEQGNSQPFLIGLCHLLGVPEPDQSKTNYHENEYTFERKVKSNSADGKGSWNRIDLYKRGCFVFESKQGQNRKSEPIHVHLGDQPKSSAVKRGTRAWRSLMDRAKRQAESYVRALPAEEGRPPFIIVADIGHCFELYSEFSCSGGNYIPYPDANSHKIPLTSLEDESIQAIFRSIWLEPLSLDPTKRTEKVTRKIAEHLAVLSRSLEDDGHTPEDVATFIIRCLFTMFSEDVGLLPENCFEDILLRSYDVPEAFKGATELLWNNMNTGGVSPTLFKEIKRFNGSLFAKPVAFDLTQYQISILIEAAKADWKNVEPSIFGTMVEQALRPKERHKLGAHYTPREYVERLVIPAVIEPIREDWSNVQSAAELLSSQGKNALAQKEIIKFHKKLCSIHVLDPACGTGNFLYVAMEHFKRLEAEVINEAKSYGQTQAQLGIKGHSIQPEQFRGIEINERAAYIAEMVLWIGHWQWEIRNFGKPSIHPPILKKYNNIQCRDALLDYDSVEPLLDDNGNPVTRWDGETKKIDPVTGVLVPDESATVQELVYINPKQAEWPESDFIVGNPPFIGNKMRRRALSGGYVDALSTAYPELPGSLDFVMYWWHKAALLVRSEKSKRFGFITTNSIGQVFNRKVTFPHLQGQGNLPALSLAYAIPDHPWVDSTDGAAVRISMTVATNGDAEGVLAVVSKEDSGDDVFRQIELHEVRGKLNSDLSLGSDVSAAATLKAAHGMCCQGVKLVGEGFLVNAEQAQRLGLGRAPNLEKHIRPISNGYDISQHPRHLLAIDLFGLDANEVRGQFPEVYQWVNERVRPEREQKKRKSQRDYWWIFAEPRATFRPALAGLERYIATLETAKHRFFVFLDKSVIPDGSLMAIASDDAYDLGVLSSRAHVLWSLAAGSRLGVGNDPRYNKTRCFETFPFPIATDEQKAVIRAISEELDAHRKRQQELHPDLTMTKMYNVLVALREGRELTKAEREINVKGLVSLLKDIHDRLDAAVLDAYGWGYDLTDEAILSKLVELNKARIEEEANGVVRWLRPEYQCKGKATQKRKAAAKGKTEKPSKLKIQSWPKALPDQFQSVRDALSNIGGHGDIEEIAKRFKRAPRKAVGEILETLAVQGLAVKLEDGVFVLNQ